MLGTSVMVTVVMPNKPLFGERGPPGPVKMGARPPNGKLLNASKLLCAVQAAEVRHVIVIGVTEDFFSRLITMRSRVQIAEIPARSTNRNNVAARQLFTMVTASAAKKTGPMQIALCRSERKPNRRSGISLKTDRCLTAFHRF